MGWYTVTKKIKGRPYLYRQRTYRVGGKVHTESHYIGAGDASGGSRGGSSREDAGNDIQEDPREPHGGDDAGTTELKEAVPAPEKQAMKKIGVGGTVKNMGGNKRRSVPKP